MVKKKKKELKTNVVLMPTPPWDLGDGHVPPVSMVILNAVHKIKVFSKISFHIFAPSFHSPLLLYREVIIVS